jgi:anti-anti-sigma factor
VTRLAGDSQTRVWRVVRSVRTAQTRQRIPVVEVVIRDALDLNGLTRLGSLLDEAIALEPAELVVDLTDCPLIDAAFIGLLLDTHRRVRRGGGYLTLRSPSPRLRRNLTLARADGVLRTSPESDRPSGESDRPGEHT